MQEVQSTQAVIHYGLDMLILENSPILYRVHDLIQSLVVVLRDSENGAEL